VRRHNFSGQREELVLAHLFGHSALRPLRAGLVSCDSEHISSFHRRKHFLAVVSKQAKKPISKAEYS
jgi:hypothetical protein